MNRPAVIDLSRAPNVLNGARIHVGPHTSQWFAQEQRYTAVPLQLERIVRGLGGKLARTLNATASQPITHVLYQEDVGLAGVAFGRSAAIALVEKLLPAARWYDLDPDAQGSVDVAVRKGGIGIASARDFYLRCVEVVGERPRFQASIVDRGANPYRGF